MANLLKFFRSATMPSVAEQNASIGSIWFDTTNNVIKVRTAENGVDADWEVYGTSPADLTAAIGRIASLEGAVKTLNETTLPALKVELEQAIADAVAAEAAIARKAEEDLGKRIDDLAAASVSVAEKADGHVRVSKATDETTGAVVYTIAENDIASAQGLADEIKRAGDEEARIEGLVTAEASRAAGEEARIEGLVTAEKGRAEGVEADLQAAIDTLNGADTVSGSVAKAVKDAKDSLLGGATTLTDFAKVETAIADAEAAAKAAASVVAEGDDAGNNLSIVPTTGENGATTYTVNLTDVASAAKVATLIGDDADKSVRTIANEELAKQLIAEGAAEALDSLQEIAQWIQDHPGDAAAMNAAIEQLQKDVDAIEADYLTESDKTELTGAIATAKGEAIDAASQNTATAIAALDATVGSQTVAEGKHVAVEVVETDGKLTGLTIVESDIASAAALATLDAEVQEHEQVIAGALNDLNDRLVAAEGSVADHETRLATAEGEIDALQTAVEGINVGVTKVTGDTTNTFVKVSATPETGDVALGVQVAVQDGATAGTKLATDTYVAEQSAAAQAAAEATAAADATSKANTAESNAKTHADNLMSWVVF